MAALLVPIIEWGMLPSMVSSALGAIIGEIFGKHSSKRRNEDSIPALVHLHHGNFTHADLQVMKGMSVQPYDDDVIKNHKVVYRSGNFSADGEFLEGTLTNGIGHGNLSISISEDGELRTGLGKWIVVDNGKANNESIEIFDKLFNDLGETAEDAIDSLTRLLELASEEISPLRDD